MEHIIWWSNIENGNDNEPYLNAGPYDVTYPLYYYSLDLQLYILCGPCLS